MGGVKIARSHIDQSCFAASIGEMRNCRQKIGGVKIARSHLDQSLGRTSIGEVCNCRQKQWEKSESRV